MQLHFRFIDFYDERSALSPKRKSRARVREVDEPEAQLHRHTQHASARNRHCKTLARMTGVALKSVKIPYCQPKLSLADSEAQEEKMRLMFAALNVQREPSRLSKNDVQDLLDFLSTCIYGDHFQHRADIDRLYRE